MKWKHFPRYWLFVRGIHRSPVNSPHKGRWRGALIFSLICAWMNGWVNNREAGDSRRHSAHYDVIVMHCMLSGATTQMTSHSKYKAQMNVLNNFWATLFEKIWSSKYSFCLFLEWSLCKFLLNSYKFAGIHISAKDVHSAVILSLEIPSDLTRFHAPFWLVLYTYQKGIQITNFPKTENYILFIYNHIASAISVDRACARKC